MTKEEQLKHDARMWNIVKYAGTASGFKAAAALERSRHDLERASDQVDNLYSENKQLSGIVAELREVLQRVQWEAGDHSHDGGWCPCCGQREEDGHGDFCPIKKALGNHPVPTDGFNLTISHINVSGNSAVGIVL